MKAGTTCLKRNTPKLSVHTLRLLIQTGQVRLILCTGRLDISTHNETQQAKKCSKSMLIITHRLPIFRGVYSGILAFSFCEVCLAVDTDMVEPV